VTISRTLHELAGVPGSAPTWIIAMTGLADSNTNDLVETMSLGDRVAEHISVCRTWSFSRGRTARARRPLRQHCCGTSFAFLSAIDRWRLAGYTIRIVYLWLNSPDTAIDRVHARARQGGHIVPDEVIRRRYDRGLLNFAHRYRDAADRWQLYDNTDPQDRRVVARGSAGLVDVVDDKRWERFQNQVSQTPRIREVLMADRPPAADDHIERWFADPENLERAMRIVVARVIRRHRLLNEPLITSRDGKVVELDPHTVPIPEGVTEEEMGPVFDYL
jgi:predicted ABC-type ATPase